MTRWVDYPWLVVGAFVACLILVAAAACGVVAVVEQCRTWAARRRRRHAAPPAPAAAPSTQDQPIDFDQRWADFTRRHPRLDSRLDSIATGIRRSKP